MARTYVGRGVQPGDVVTISLPNGIDFVVHCTATWKCGAVPNPISPRLPLPERAAIIARSAIVECSAMDFYRLAEAIESYPDFLPWCSAAVVHERAPGRTVATLTLAVRGLGQSFTTENTNLPGQSIDMSLVQGPFRHFAAAWRFTPLGAGACKAEYSMQYEFSSRLVAGALEHVFRRIADGTVEAFTRRARTAPGDPLAR